MMTRREVFTKAMSMFTEGSEEYEVMAKAIASLEKKSSKPTKAQIENEGIKTEIRAVLGAEPKTARQIADEVGYTVNKVASLLKQIEGVVKTEGKGKNPATYTITITE